jgi:hypothetical protein
VTEHRYVGTVGSFWRERFCRGRDFADARVIFERWPRARIAAYLVALPLLVAVVVARGANQAFHAGWGRDFLRTFPLQLVGHTAWSLGEAVTHASLLFRFARQLPP